MRSDARKRSDNLSLRRGAGSMPSPGGDATTPAVVALTDADLDALVALIANAARGGCGSHQGCRDLVAKKQRDAARRWWVDHRAAAGVVSDAAAEDDVPGLSVLPERMGNVGPNNPAAVSGVAAGSKADTQREDLGLDDFDVRYQR